MGKPFYFDVVSTEQKFLEREQVSGWMESNKTDGYYYWQRTMELFLDALEKRTQPQSSVAVSFGDTDV